MRHLRSFDIPLPEVRLLLVHAAEPEASCTQVDNLLDGHISLVRQRVRALRSLEKQLVALRKTCDGDVSNPCAILQSFTSAARQQVSATQSATGSHAGA